MTEYYPTDWPSAACDAIDAEAERASDAEERAEKAEARVAELLEACRALDFGPGYCPECGATSELLGGEWQDREHAEDCFIGQALRTTESNSHDTSKGTTK